MRLFDKIMGRTNGEPEHAESPNNASALPLPQKPVLPTLSELRDMIVKSQLLFRRSLAEAEASARKSQELYNRKFSATPDERRRLTQLQASQDLETRRKMAQAQVSAKNTAMLQDVEVVMQIEEAFASCGMAVSDERKATNLADLLKEVQKEMQVAEQAISNTILLTKNVDATISIPAGTNSAVIEERPELAALYEQYNRETDQAKREELEREIRAKDPGKPVQVTLGAV